ISNDLFPTLVIHVRTGPECILRRAPQACLLLDLAKSRVELVLFRLELALGEGPVVVGGPVDHGHLDAAPSAGLPDDATGTPNRRAPPATFGRSAEQGHLSNGIPSPDRWARR